MPTGYTAKLYDGEQSFEAFVLGCARAFGAAINMRDDDSDVPITIEAITDTSDYHVKGVRTAKAELARLTSLSAEQLEREARAAYLDRVEADVRYTKDALAKRDRYERMLKQVREWRCPSEEHAEFRQFMINQLTGSIDFDTSLKHHTPPVQQEPAEWLAGRIERAERDIKYHSEEESKRIERNAERIRWVNQLRESLGLEALATITSS